MTKKLLTAASAATTGLMLAAMPVFAAITSDYDYDLDLVITSVVNWSAIIAGIIVLIYLIIAGIKYVTSSGDPGKTEEAQKQIISAIIGLAIVVLAYALVRLVTSLLGVGGLSLENMLNTGSGTWGRSGE